MQIGLDIFTLAAMGGLFAAISSGLLGIPDMQISGNGSYSTWLHWTINRIENQLPEVRVLCVKQYVFKGLILRWSLWLAASLIKWLKWAWKGFSYQGLWKKTPKLIKPKVS